MKKGLLIIIKLVVLFAVFTLMKKTFLSVSTTVDTNTVAVPAPGNRGQQEQYIRTHINKLSKTQPVLGGSWYVTEIRWNNNGTVGTVSYEDGHIAAQANFTAVQQPSGEVIISFTSEQML